MKVFNTFFLVFFIALSLPAYSQDIKIRNIDGSKEKLAFDILSLALKKTRPDVTFSPSNESFNEARLIEEVISRNIDIIWAGASPEKEMKMLPIRIPILKGLLGHRIFIIRNEDKERFSSIKTMNELKSFTAGQGRFWGDTKVLKSAGIPVISTIKYENLFYMLEGGRFDYFPRAIHEPWVEVDSRPELDLAIDNNVLIIYPFPLYFFVNKSNQDLHDDIYSGLEIAIKDGSFDKLFFNHPMIKDALEKSRLKDRVIFRLDNPHLHDKTPFDRKEFWLDISEL
ncbi:diguanylate cyclase [Salinivibrio sp. KP-1]|nr:diguanylate cyclase [Salinivibrio sp. KP-1]